MPRRTRHGTTRQRCARAAVTQQSTEPLRNRIAALLEKTRTKPESVVLLISTNSSSASKACGSEFVGVDHSLVNLQALEVNRRERVGELVCLHDVDAVSVQKVRHCGHLRFVSSADMTRAYMYVNYVTYEKTRGKKKGCSVVEAQSSKALETKNRLPTNRSNNTTGERQGGSICTYFEQTEKQKTKTNRRAREGQTRMLAALFKTTQALSCLHG